MYIKKIILNSFRNYNQQEIELEPDVSIFFGDNAQGKTNILESIFICAMGKSFRAKKEKDLINLEKEIASIQVEYCKKDRDGKIKIEIGNQKNIWVNGIKVQKFSEILGNINIVMFSPDDINILKEGPLQRRKFLNIMISQLRPNYTYCYNRWLKTLEQRNNYLRQIKLENKDSDLLDIWDEKLVEYSKYIYEYRKEFIEKIKSKINNIHEKITNNQEKIDLKYQSDCEDIQKYKEKLKNNRKMDILRGYTINGIQKDDFSILINGKLVQTFGSQGQHRTAILSLKLAELQVIYDEIQEYPILLLDDFMSELDEKRRKSLIENIEDTQVLITCTQDFLLQNKKSEHYKVENGKVKKE